MSKTAKLYFPCTHKYANVLKQSRDDCLDMDSCPLLKYICTFLTAHKKGSAIRPYNEWQTRIFVPAKISVARVRPRRRSEFMSWTLASVMLEVSISYARGYYQSCWRLVPLVLEVSISRTGG